MPAEALALLAVPMSTDAVGLLDSALQLLAKDPLVCLEYLSKGGHTPTSMSPLAPAILLAASKIPSLSESLTSFIPAALISIGQALGTTAVLASVCERIPCHSLQVYSFKTLVPSHYVERGST